MGAPDISKLNPIEKIDLGYIEKHIYFMPSSSCPAELHNDLNNLIYTHGVYPNGDRWALGECIICNGKVVNVLHTKEVA